MAFVLEEVTAHCAAMVGVAAIETVTFAVPEAVTFASGTSSSDKTVILSLLNGSVPFSNC
jgi:hypothetical protein